MCKEFKINGEYYCTLGSLRNKFGRSVVEKLLSENKVCNDDDSCCLCDVSPEALGAYLKCSVVFDGCVYYFDNDAKDIRKNINKDDFLVTIC